MTASALSGRTAIVGVGYTAFGRESGKSVLSLATEACRKAVSDAGASLEEVDGILSYSAGDSVPGHAVATALGLPGLSYALDLNMGGQAPAMLALTAAMAVSAGMARNVLVFRALNGRSGTRIGSELYPAATSQYRYPVGITAMPQYMALRARRYMIETGATEDDLAAVAVAQRAFAVNNPRAMRRTPLTRDDYWQSPYIAEPYRSVDCTIEVDGACAVLITSIERARQLQHAPAVIAGGSWATGRRSGLDVADTTFWDDFSINCQSAVAPGLWASTGMRPADITVAEIYDCFSGAVLFGLEGLGLVGRGEAGAFVRSGATGAGGELPTNTHGGLINEGYVHGMNTLSEAVLQVQGRAVQQVADPSVTLVTSGTLNDGSALVLTREA